MNGTQFIARILKEEGVKQMTCFPSNALIEEVSKEGIRPIMFRHERGAVMAADGFARSGGGEGFGTVMMQQRVQCATQFSIRVTVIRQTLHQSGDRLAHQLGAIFGEFDCVITTIFSDGL